VSAGTWWAGMMVSREFWDLEDKCQIRRMVRRELLGCLDRAGAPPGPISWAVDDRDETRLIFRAFTGPDRLKALGAFRFEVRAFGPRGLDAR
jgi:hypothetical protein